ncbi:spore germination protein GerW family protein [Clostridium sp. JN-1]|jgi:uncharacterized spore protein YtfJ|uniref:GerW family sporulation protein n=1 Tax=Clostridium sp. JN-1 TaxID=2483110 RepID=UPI000F0BA9A3|nr:spore germination protein GerW family protein [Clostridium sp. JN-1]
MGPVPENLDMLFTKLEDFFNTRTVVGDPIEVGETTLVPIISVTFGFGTGAGENQNARKNKSDSGSGVGMGAKIASDAVIVVRKDGTVKILPVNGRDNLVNLIEKVPEIVSKFNFKKSEDKK